MKKGQVYEGIVEKVSFPNRCVVSVEGGEKKVLVKNALPGQRVRLRLTKVRRGTCEGNLLEVLEPAENELSAGQVPCEHFGTCGGCTYQHLSYEDQLALKENQLRELLAPVVAAAGGNFDDAFGGIAASPRQFGYRNKMEFSFGDACKGGELALGMHKRGSFYDIVTVSGCRIVDEDFCRILTAALDYFSARQISYFHKNTHEGYLRHLLVRKAVKTGEILIDLVTTTQTARLEAENVHMGAQNGCERSGFVGTEAGCGAEQDECTAMQTGCGEGQAGCMETEGGCEDSRTGSAGAETGCGKRWAGRADAGLCSVDGGPDLVATAFFAAEARMKGGTPSERELLAGFAETLKRLKLDGSIAGILHTRNDSVADVVKDEGTEILYGKDFFYEELLGLRFLISPFSFFQTNSLGAEVLYETARGYVGDLRKAGKEGAVVYDLYSGTGTIAQLLAPVAGKVIGVEIVGEAVEAAKKNAALNGLSNCEFLAGDVLKVLDTVTERPDFIVLDPPRDGIHPKALEQIIRYGVERMVYISCKPTSLARDLEVLQAAGYRVERVRGVDMFPGTVHCETICLLTRIK